MSSANTPEGSGTPVPDLPVVTPALRRRLQQCYEHAKKLMAQPKYDFDYANTMLTECVVSDPGSLLYVGTFLENLGKKYDNNKKGAKLQFFVNRSAVKKAQTAKLWLEVLKAGPQTLKTNPWDIPTLRSMAEACEHLQLSEVELRYLKNALDGNPKDVEVSRHCARSLARMGQYDQAIACWARVSELKRNDAEAEKMIGDLQVEKTKWKFGMLTADDLNKRGAGAGKSAPSATKPVKPSDEMRMQVVAPPVETETEVAPAAPKKRDMQLSPTQVLLRAISDDPAQVENYLDLAAVFGGEGKLVEAERILQKGLAVSSSDLRLRERLEEVNILRLKQQLALAERRAQAEPTEAAKELTKQLREGLNRTELEMLSSRSERYPQELKWKYEVGIRLKKAGNYSEAMMPLRQVGDLPELAAAAQLEIGECLQHLRQFPKSLQAYAQAATLAEENAQEDQLKLALYRGGVLATAMGDPSGQALLARVVALDPNFRDAQGRLDKIRGVRQNT